MVQYTFRLQRIYCSLENQLKYMYLNPLIYSIRLPRHMSSSQKKVFRTSLRISISLLIFAPSDIVPYCIKKSESVHRQKGYRYYNIVYWLKIIIHIVCLLFIYKKATLTIFQQTKLFTLKLKTQSQLRLLRQLLSYVAAYITNLYTL